MNAIIRFYDSELVVKIPQDIPQTQRNCLYCNNYYDNILRKKYEDKTRKINR